MALDLNKLLERFSFYSPKKSCRLLGPPFLLRFLCVLAAWKIDTTIFYYTTAFVWLLLPPLSFLPPFFFFFFLHPDESACVCVCLIEWSWREKRFASLFLCVSFLIFFLLLLYKAGRKTSRPLDQPTDAVLDTSSLDRGIPKTFFRCRCGAWEGISRSPPYFKKAKAEPKRTR